MRPGERSPARSPYADVDEFAVLKLPPLAADPAKSGHGHVTPQRRLVHEVFQAGFGSYPDDDGRCLTEVNDTDECYTSERKVGIP